MLTFVLVFLLAGNAIGDKGAIELGKGLVASSSLKHLWLAGTHEKI